VTTTAGEDAARTPRYEEQPPDPSLAAHVHCTWFFEGDENGAEQAVPPDGRCELIAHGTQAYDERGADGAWRTQAPLVFAGQLTRPLVLRSRGAVAVVGVRFKPAGAWAFVGAPLASCTDLRLDLAALHGAAAVAALQAQLRGAADAPARIAVLSRYVATQIALRDGRRDHAVEACVERLLASEGRVSRAELGALAALGERQLQRRFAEVVGISPRMLAVVVRLRRVFEALRDAPWSTWSERAQAAGFFDHPQMARDFRRLLGKAPSQWAAGGPGLSASLAAADG
jgi:AraC-like DNA-binding protein